MACETCGELAGFQPADAGFDSLARYHRRYNMRNHEAQLLCSTTNRKVYEALEKKRRADGREINCRFCKYHRVENAGRKERARKIKLGEMI